MVLPGSRGSRKPLVGRRGLNDELRMAEAPCVVELSGAGPAPPWDPTEKGLSVDYPQTPTLGLRAEHAWTLWA
jgi:hypothetical protein